VGAAALQLAVGSGRRPAGDQHFILLIIRIHGNICTTKIINKMQHTTVTGTTASVKRVWFWFPDLSAGACATFTDGFDALVEEARDCCLERKEVNKFVELEPFTLSLAVFKLISNLDFATTVNKKYMISTETYIKKII
jgi:hypothetical protein